MTAPPAAAPTPTPAARGHPGRAIAILAVAFVGGYLAASLGYLLVLRPAGLVFLWPPSGAVLGVLLVTARRDWPAILTGTLVANLVVDMAHGASVGLAFAGAAVNTLEQLAAAYVVQRLGDNPVRMVSLRDVRAFFVGAVLGVNSVAALFGAFVIMGYGQRSYATAWFNWWVGDGVGMLILAPPIVTAVHAIRNREALSRRADAVNIALLVAVAIAAAVLLNGSNPLVSAIEGHAYLVLPLAILAGLRMGPAGATFATLLIAAVTGWHAAGQSLVLGEHADSATTRALAVYAYLGLAALSAQIPAVAIAERERVLQSLRESEGRFRQIADNIAETFFIVERPGGRVLYVSPSWSTIWGRPIEQAYDVDVWTESTHPEDRSAVRAALEAAGRGEPAGGDCRILRPDGATRWLRGRAFPVRDPNGHVSRIVGLAEDVTELRDTEWRFAQAQKLEAVGRLAGGVAHDFNNLLTVIFAETEFLLRKGDLTPAQRDQVAEVRRAAESASSLTRQLLAFSRQQVVEPRLIDVNDVVRDTAKMLSRLIGENIHLEMRLATTPVTIVADRGQVEQLIANLAVNARDAMPEGGVLTVETAVEETPGDMGVEAAEVAERDPPPHGWVSLALRDTGSGMSEEVVAHVFEPFFTTKGTGRGTGLGLATCHGIVTQAGGRIGIVTAPGRGTTVRALFPRAEGSAPTAPTIPPAPGGRERILLVEDEAGVRRVAGKMLRHLGYDVSEAEGGEDALRQLADSALQVDLLLTDVVMPGMSGRELADRVRGMRPAVKVLFASGYTDDVVLQEQMIARDAAFVSKPFSLVTLGRRVRDVLDDRGTGPTARG